MVYFRSQPRLFPVLSSGGAAAVARNGAQMSTTAPLYKPWGPFTLTDGKKFTVSGWFGDTDKAGVIWAMADTSTFDNYFSFEAVSNGSGGFWLNLIVSLSDASGLDTVRQITLDASKKYYFCLAFDTTQATAANRLKLWLGEYGSSSEPVAQDIWGATGGWVNNSAPTNITQNLSMIWTNELELISTTNVSVGVDFIIADFYHIDGQAKLPTDFGLLSTSQWKPKLYSGTYGNAGYHLDFALDTDMGNDVSGNNNDFVPGAYTQGSNITLSTMFGNMTGNGGLNAAKDGSLTQGAAACAALNSSGVAYIGADLGTAKNIFHGKIYASTDQGFVNGANPTVTWTLRAHSAQPSNASEAASFGRAVTNLGFGDANEGGSGRTLASFDTIGIPFQYAWFVGASQSNNQYVGEIVFAEATLNNVLNAGDKDIPGWL